MVDKSRMSMRAFWCRVGWIAVLAGLPGCGYATRVDEPVWRAVQGPVAVDVESFNGDVTIVVDPDYPNAMVQVRRRALHGARRGSEAEAALERVRYSVEVVAGEAGPVLEVRTWTDDPEPWFLRADVRVYAPAIQGVRVRTTNGRVQAEDIQGRVDIENEEGDVRILTTRPMVERVTVVCRNGDIDYRVRGGSSGEFNCQSHGGLVDQRIEYGQVVIHAGTDDDTLLATVNRGENPVQLRTAGGDIRVSIVDEPLDVGPVISDP